MIYLKALSTGFLGLLAMSTSAIAGSASIVYVESNRNDSNSILSYSRDANGKLTPLASFPTGGKGVVDSSFALGPFDSDQELISDAGNRHVFAVNSGSNSIAVFNVDSRGNLSPVRGSPFNSHGVNPVSLGLSGNLLTVVNQHGDPAQVMDQSLPNYTTFFVDPNGALRWTGSVMAVAKGSSPSQALVAPNGRAIFGADFLGGVVRSMGINAYGRLYPIAALGLPAGEFPNEQTPRFPLGLITHPRAPVLYVGFPTANKIGVYTFDTLGRLRFQGAASDSGTVVCWMRTNRAGTRLYASNTGDASVTVYDIGTNALRPREIQRVALPTKGGAYQLSLTPDESGLIVLTQRFQAATPVGQGNEIHSFRVSPKDGTLTMGQTPFVALDLPGDTRPQGVLVL